MKNVFIGVAVLIVVVVVVAIYGGAGKGLYSNPSSNTNTAPTNQNVAPNNVSIQNFSFNPQALTIKTGTTVTWTNNDSVMHKIRSSTFNSAGLNQGDTFKFTFNSTGTFNYDCAIHPTMTGTIIVQ